MPFIIAATDFSEISLHAVDYAAALASDHRWGLIIAHSYMIPVMFNEVAMPATLISDTQHDAESQMNALEARLTSAHPDLEISGHVAYGDFIDVINEYSKNNVSPLMVVLGNSLAAGETWPDNNLMDALRNLRYPALAVPSHAAYKPVRKICLAFEDKAMKNYQVLDLVAQISVALQAELHVVNIQKDVHTQDNSPDFSSPAKERLNKASAHFHMVFDAADIDKAIEDFAHANEMDILVMIPARHSFFESLFYKSHTKAVTGHSGLPVLSIH